MIHFALTCAIWLPLLVIYGAMFGVTTQIARRAGMKDGTDVACGAFWPLGLGLALAYGSSHGLSKTPIERQAASMVSAEEQRYQEMEQQQHNTRMAELKMKESMALERAVNPTYKAKEEIAAPPPQSLQ